MPDMRILAAVVLAGALLIGAAGRARAADEAEAARLLVDRAMADTSAALAEPHASTTERNQRLRDVVDRYIDVASLGRGSVGAVWQRTEPGQQDGFIAEFKKFLFVSYVGSMARAEAPRFAPATVVEADGRRALVRTEVRSGEGPPCPVLFTVVHGDDGGERITDIAAQGISLRTTLVADFGAFLSRSGGRIEALIDRLREKIAAHPAD